MPLICIELHMQLTRSRLNMSPTNHLSFQIQKVLLSHFVFQVYGRQQFAFWI